MLIGEFVLLAYYNLVSDYVYDQDASKVLYRAVKIWENGSLILPNWSYETTGEWDCATFFAIFIYGITKNIILSFAISNIINIAIFVLVVYVLLTSVGVKRRSAMLALCILLIPYGWGMLEYTNMLFFSAAQYIYKVMAPLCLLAVFHYRDRYESKAGYYVLLAFTLLLLFLTITSSGLYVAACGLVAIYLTRILYLLVQKKRPRTDHLVAAVLALLMVGVSYDLHNRWGVNSQADSMAITELMSLPDNFRSLILGFFDVFQIAPESSSVFSRDGLTTVVKLPLVLFILIYGLSNMGRTLCLDRLTGYAANETDDQYLIKSELISITMVNALIIFLTTPTPENRYQLIGLIPLILVAVISFDRKDDHTPMIGIMFALLFFVNMFVQYDAYTDKPCQYDGDYSKEVCLAIIDEARQENVDLVVIYSQTEWSEVTRAYDTDLEVITYNKDDQMFHDYDISNGDKDLSYIYGKKCIIVSNNGFNLDDNAPYFREHFKFKEYLCDEYFVYVMNE